MNNDKKILMFLILYNTSYIGELTKKQFEFIKAHCTLHGSSLGVSTVFDSIFFDKSGNIRKKFERCDEGIHKILSPITHYLKIEAKTQQLF